MPDTTYVVITPARDEELTLDRTVRSMVEQSVRPACWVIVDDGSTDRTGEIADGHAAEHPWIEVVHRSDRGFRELGSGVVDAFQDGMARVGDFPWDYVVKLDADLSFAPDYFENLLRRFAQNPRLGMASGKTFVFRNGTRKLEWCHDDHVRGVAKMYSRDCFEAIGGIQPVRGWDVIDEVTAQMHGFETKSFLEEHIVHYRPIDGRQSNVLRSRYDMGKQYHYLGYHWLYLSIRSLRSAVQDYPLIVGGALVLMGFLRSAITSKERYDEAFTEFMQRKQLGRVSLQHFRYFLETRGMRA